LELIHQGGDANDVSFILGYAFAVLLFVVPAALLIFFGIRWVKDKRQQKP
jgi:hypothetical protein